MKVNVGTLKRLIREVAEANDPGVEPGTYYWISDAVWRSPGVAKVLSVNEDPKHPGMLFVQFKSRSDSTSTQRLETFMARVQREASPEEAQAAEAWWDDEAAEAGRRIDTSREGT